MKILDCLRQARADGRAVLAANFYNAETLMGVVRAARATELPVILQTSPSTLDYLGVPLAAAMARAAARQAGVQAFLHLDHARERETIQACVDAGYDSVMLDASERPLDENIALTKVIVDLAHPAGVAVEAELGRVPKLGEAEATGEQLTRPEEAAAFARETGIDYLAVAIGTAHGFYRGEPKLDVDRLGEIAKVVSIPLVLHGGSGLSAQQWRDCIACGIAKINFATEIKDTFMRAVRERLLSSEDIDLRKLFPPGIEAVVDLVSSKMRLCDSCA